MGLSRFTSPHLTEQVPHQVSAGGLLRPALLITRIMLLIMYTKKKYARSKGSKIPGWYMSSISETLI